MLNKTAPALRALADELAAWQSDPLVRLIGILADEAEAGTTQTGTAPQKSAADDARAALSDARAALEMAKAAEASATGAASQAAAAAASCADAYGKAAEAVASLEDAKPEIAVAQGAAAELAP